MLERDPVKLLEWVARARSSVLDRIEDGQTAEMANNTNCKML
jgi:hypothetical protein